MTEYIKNFFIKKYSDKYTIDKKLIKLVKILYLNLNQTIMNLAFEYNRIDWNTTIDFKIIYNLLFLLYKYYTVKKIKFSKARKYFIYEINENVENVKKTKHLRFSLEKIMYIIFDYSKVETKNKIICYNVYDLDDLHDDIKKNI